MVGSHLHVRCLLVGAIATQLPYVVMADQLRMRCSDTLETADAVYSVRRVRFFLY